VLVQRFEAVTSDVVTSHGGRIIKTVGDEVLFVGWPPQAAAAIALDIASEIGADPLMPDVRVGVATGQVVARLGDVFGTTVNRASRLTSIAAPGTVLVDDATARVLTAISGFTCTPLRRRTLKGIGTVAPWLLNRSSRGGPGTTGRAPVDVEAVEKAVEAPDASEDRPFPLE
jgi:adenylate cyclase